MPEFVSFAFALFFAWLFAVSAWHKLRHPEFYRELLRTWFVQKAGSVGIWPLALMECLIVLSLLVPASRNSALLLVAALLLVYAAAMGWQLLRGRTYLKCGCAGPAAATTISRALVWRNLICAQLALLAANPVAAGSVHALNVAVALLVAVFLCLLYLCCEQLLSNAQHFALEKR